MNNNLITFENAEKIVKFLKDYKPIKSQDALKLENFKKKTLKDIKKLIEMNKEITKEFN